MVLYTKEYFPIYVLACCPYFSNIINPTQILRPSQPVTYIIPSPFPIFRLVEVKRDITKLHSKKFIAFVQNNDLMNKEARTLFAFQRIHIQVLG